MDVLWIFYDLCDFFTVGLLEFPIHCEEIRGMDIRGFKNGRQHCYTLYTLWCTVQYKPLLKNARFETLLKKTYIF